MKRSVFLCTLAITFGNIALLGSPTALAAETEQGVLAKLPFLDEIPGYGAVGDDHIVIDISADAKRPFQMLLDTGASHNVLTPKYARKLGVRVRRHKSDAYRKETVLGRDVQFWVDTSSSDTGSRSGMEVGLLGGMFLQKYVVEVDYDAKRVRFLDSDKRGVSKKNADATEIVRPLRFTDMRPTAEIQLGSGSLWFLVDTGAPLDLAISEEKARALGIDFSSAEVISKGINWYGTDRWANITLPSVRVGSLEIEDVELAVALHEGSSYRATNIAGPDEALLGNAFLRRFRVQFDYPHRKLALLPRPQAKDTEMAKADPKASAADTPDVGSAPEP